MESQRMRRLPDSELEVMKVLWAAGRPVTSAYISGELRNGREWKITSVLTFLARLAEKGFVTSTRHGRGNLYAAAVDEQRYLESEGKSVLEKLYDNSLTTFVSTLYRGRAIDDDDLAELQRFINEASQKK